MKSNDISGWYPLEMGEIRKLYQIDVLKNVIVQMKIF